MLVLNHFYCFDSVSVNCEQWTLCAHIVVSRWINSSSGSFERESHSRSHVSSMQYALNIAIANEQTRPSELFMRHLIAALIVLAHGAQNTFIEMRERFCKRWNSRMKRFWYWSSLSLCGCVCVYQTIFRRCTVHQFFLSYKSELDIAATVVVVVVVTVFGIIIIIIIINMSQSSTPTDIKLSLCTTATNISPTARRINFISKFSAKFATCCDGWSGKKQAHTHAIQTSQKNRGATMRASLQHTYM